MVYETVPSLFAQLLVSYNSSTFKHKVPLVRLKRAPHSLVLPRYVFKCPQCSSKLVQQVPIQLRLERLESFEHSK